MRVLVCGGRGFGGRSDEGELFRNAMAAYRDAALVIEGGAAGADNLARGWASIWGIPCWTFKADWRDHGRAAGPIRNQRMIDEGRPDLVIAFPGGRGTADMVRRARAAGVTVVFAATHPKTEDRHDGR